MDEFGEKEATETDSNGDETKSPENLSEYGGEGNSPRPPSSKSGLVLRGRKASSSNCSSVSSSARKRWEKPEFCLICGQPAQCLNFGAHCCHACRMFFRRSVLNFKDFTCKFDGNCDTTKGKNCRSCRFDACVMARLDISLIQFPTHFDVPALKRRLEEKRREVQLRRQEQQQWTDAVAPSSPFSPSSPAAMAGILPIPGGIERSFSSLIDLVEFNKCLDHLLLADKQAMRLRCSPNNLLLEYLCGKQLADLLAGQMNVLNFVELFTMDGAPLKNDEQRMMEASGVPFIGNYLNLDMLLNIELMRTLPVLAALSMEDKVALFRQNTHKLVTLSNGFYAFQLNADTVVYPNQMCPSNLCRNTLERTLKEDKLKRYVNLRRRAFHDMMAEFKSINLSLEEFVLLRAVIFCNTVPEQCSAQAKALLKGEAETYGRCLLRYLQMRFGELEGARKYAECLLFATKIFDYNRRQGKFYELLDREAFGLGQGPNPAHPPFVFECLLGANGASGEEKPF